MKNPVLKVVVWIVLTKILSLANETSFIYYNLIAINKYYQY